MSHHFSTSTRYIPQFPTPHSPPETPSPSSPTKPSNLDVIMAAFDSSAPGPSRLTPDNTPEARYHEPPSYLEQFTYPEQLPYAEAFHPNHPELASPIPVAGKGIQFPPSHNPLPIELTQATPELPKHSLTNDHTSFPSSISHSKSETTSPNPTHPSYLPYHGPPRPRSTSPRPPALELSQGFASSSSLGHGGDQQHRERVVSPTFRSTPTQSTPIDLNSSSEFDRRSPAMDGKKEPPIKSYPIPPYNPDSFDGRRSVYPTQSHHYAYGYQNHPLSGNGMGNYTEKGREVGPVKGEKERFIESTGCWLGLYFCFNLGLTLFNKVVLTSFPFPYTLTGLHALSGCAGCYFALERGAFVPARLTQKENLILAGFSVLYTINIAVSSISLQLVTIPFHQVVRASTPLFTIIISMIVLRTRVTPMKVVSLLPVIVGVGFATYGDYSFTAWGLILTLLGTGLAAMKTVVTNVIQTGGGGRLKLHPLDLLMRMSPLAFIQCVAYGWCTGELERVRRYGATQMTQGKAIALLINGIIACGLNIVSFTANKKAGPLTMTVSANCKQVLTIALAVVLFDLHINFMNAVGILLTLIGGGWYGYVEYSEKNMKRAVGKILDKS